MTAVYQTDFRMPGGNCFQACVASIMDLPLSEVPHFLKDSNGWWTQPLWNAVKEFAQKRGYEACWLDPDNLEEIEQIEAMKRSELHYIATGRSPRSEYGHCVVGRGGEIIHDPMAKAGGCHLASEPWLYIFFLPAPERPQ